MSVTPGPVAMLPSSRNGRAAGVPARTRCPCGRSAGRADTGLPLEGADHGAAEASVGIRPVVDPGTDALHELARPAPDFVDACRDVAAVDHQVLRSASAGRSASMDARRAARSASVGGDVTGIAGSLARLLSCRDRAPDRDPPARGTQRLPARAGGEARLAIGRRRTFYGRQPGRHALVLPWATILRGPGPIRSPRSSRGSAACDPITARAWAGRRPSLVGSRALDRHLPVDRRGAGADLAEAALALAERDVSPSRTAQLTGHQERQSRAGPRGSPRRGRRRRGSVTRTGSRSCRSAGQTARARCTRLITHILLRAGRRVGTTTSDGSSSMSGWSMRATGRVPVARPWSSRGATSRSACSRRPVAGSSCAASATIERRERPDERLL